MDRLRGRRVLGVSTIRKRERWPRTFSRAQRAAVSAGGMRSHARVNSKSVSGAAGEAPTDPGAGAGAGSWGGSATVGKGTSRVLNTVSLPDMRKMPPPTRPADFASRACFASLNDAGVGFCVAGARASAGAGTGGAAAAAAAAVGVGFPSEGGGVEGDSTRELMGFRRASVGRGASGDIEGGGCGVSSSTIVIGMRRCFRGAVVVVVEGEGEDVGTRGVETSTGVDCCET
jgi:hypothetical protein